MNRKLHNMSEDSTDPGGKEHFSQWEKYIFYGCTLSGNLLPNEDSSGTGVLSPVLAGSNILSALVIVLDQFSEVDKTHSAIRVIRSMVTYFSFKWSRTPPKSSFKIIRIPKSNHDRVAFANTLTKNAATLKPFELNVDLAKWQIPANRSISRHMCPQRQFEIQ